MGYQYPRGNVFYRKLNRSYPLVTHGEGIYLYDENGKRYIDGSGGAIVVNIGHGRKEIFEDMADQMARVGYVHGTQFTTKALEDYATALGKILPKGLDKIYFLSGGSEAVEAAVKFARQYALESGKPQRWRVAARWQSYHGNTIGALSLTGRVGMRRPYLPLLINFPHFPPPYCYRCPFGLTHPECKLECANALENLIKLEGSETISAVIIEPVIGATVGAISSPEGYLERIRSICDKYGILMIVDEVMSGMGRTGKWFAIEHWGVIPDIMVLGKGMAGGYFPLSAMITKTEYIDLLKEKTGAFTHGHTFSHHPVACMVGHSVLKYIEKHGLLENCERQGKYLLKRLEELKSFSFVGDVRGKGLMTAIEFVKDKDTKTPFPRNNKFAEKVTDLAFENGLVLYPGIGFVDGVDGDMVMVGPPLTIKAEEIDEIIEILKLTFSQIEKELS